MLTFTVALPLPLLLLAATLYERRASSDLEQVGYFHSEGILPTPSGLGPIVTLLGAVPWVLLLPLPLFSFLLSPLFAAAWWRSGRSRHRVKLTLLYLLLVVPLMASAGGGIGTLMAAF